MKMLRIVALGWVIAFLAGCGSTTANPTAVPVPTTAQSQGDSTSVPAATSVPGEATQQPESGSEAGITPAPAGSIPAIALQKLVEGFDRPVYVAHAGDDSGRLFVVEQPGRIRIVRDGALVEEPFLDIVDQVESGGNEQGLLGIAFHPQYKENGYLYVNYTALDGDAVISRFNTSGDTVDRQSEKQLMKIEDPYPNHNGGLLLFGPDSYLYIGMGDGGSAGDPQGNGQKLDALLGKMLRIDVDTGDPYGIPADNPWANGGARPEVWAYGLRNPWRYSFDRATGDLYIADVGQNILEEVNFQPAGSKGGENYGWNTMEGSECYRGSCDPAGLVLPVAEYTHAEGGCSITGGYVYRGPAYPAMQGIYFYGDYCSGTIWGLRRSGSAWENAEVLASNARISSFGEDQAGELYLTDLNSGAVYQVVPAQ